MLRLLGLSCALCFFVATEMLADSPLGKDLEIFSNLDDAIDAEIDDDWFLCAADAEPLAIFGQSLISAEVMTEFVRRVNPHFNAEVAETYFEIGELYGLRGDVALCQAVIETGWFKFDRGTAVKLEQNNFCGLGVTTRGVKGAEFPTVRDGVKAHLQHLFAYASVSDLPHGEELVDPRFAAVRRGCATCWTDLNWRWAMNGNYGQHIEALYKKMTDFAQSFIEAQVHD